MITQRGRTLLTAVACLLALGALSACGGGDAARESGQSRDSSSNSNTGGGFRLFGERREYGSSSSGSEAAAIGVNTFLWRASLDTLNFMPLASADPFGGVIITDWYSSASTPNERFKATVYILDTRLRADALNVSLFKQVRQGNDWRDASVDPDTEAQLENAILRRARELRLGTLEN